MGVLYSLSRQRESFFTTHRPLTPFSKASLEFLHRHLRRHSTYVIKSTGVLLHASQRQHQFVVEQGTSSTLRKRASSLRSSRTYEIRLKQEHGLPVSSRGQMKLITSNVTPVTREPKHTRALWQIPTCHSTDNCGAGGLWSRLP